jgi:hypothetical protein
VSGRAFTSLNYLEKYTRNCKFKFGSSENELFLKKFRAWNVSPKNENENAANS